MASEEAEQFQPATLADWRDWLAANHTRREGVWVIGWRSKSGRTPLPYDDLVREALCWGWIDGQVKGLDDQRAMQWMSPRRLNSPWAASNKARVADLEREGRLQPAGIAAIERAKANGMWTVFDSVEALVEPPELVDALDANAVARTTWDSCAPSIRKQALALIALAKRSETRASRIATIVARVGRGERPV
ncbi:YdeI/OmpD-associated family protein [Tessaracoccus sp. SD287]|uniref:YdeI/OmpD-associated family protein n=1 Tax=Tessaracoccus sp. SD287 TaxID=2782008 RepID=UPI001D71B92C|nr:YdeI/OmpD-associated family protein [Tessaracoccus sp. SD287]MBO1030106.1 YdeI/OmpD-associated family protein [Tessaracoccus sp. SD287]